MGRRLSEGTIRLGARVASAGPHEVRLESGETIGGDAVVVATEGPEAARLTGLPAPGSRPVTCLYFAAERAPVREPILVLDGDGQGPANNVVVHSAVAPTYAPPGAALVGATVLGRAGAHDAGLEAGVRAQLGRWFGGGVRRWRHLRTYHIPFAQPDQAPPALTPWRRDVRVRPGLYICGDHVDNASINGAMESGRRAAEAVLADRSRG